MESHYTGQTKLQKPEVVQRPSAALDNRVRRRLMMLIGLAYLLLTALATGLTWVGAYDEQLEKQDDQKPDEPAAPGQPVAEARPQHAPGLHIRPDGSKYLIVPLQLMPAGAAQ